MTAPVKVARQQTTPELSGTFRTLHPEPTRAGTLRNPPEPSEPCLRNLHQHAPELSRTLRNFLKPSGTNLSEPSGTYLLNLSHPSEIFRNLPPEPTPFYTGTLRNLPEPASGTYTSTRKNFPELFGTFRNLPHEPAPATRTGTHRSLSGLKTAVGKNANLYIFLFEAVWCTKFRAVPSHMPLRCQCLELRRFRCVRHLSFSTSAPYS